MGDTMEISLLVEGGKASGGPPLGPSIGPTGIPIKDVVDTLNKKTADFKGLKVPCVVSVNLVNKTFEVKISTPSTSSLLFKEVGLEGGSGKSGSENVGDVTFEQVAKVARMKRDTMASLSFKGAVKCVLGTCLSSGLTVEGKNAKIVQKEVAEGKYDDQLKE
jgi:large subunit ribosomal protein L11